MIDTACIDNRKFVDNDTLRETDNSCLIHKTESFTQTYDGKDKFISLKKIRTPNNGMEPAVEPDVKSS